MNEWYKAHGHTGVHQYLEKLFSQLNSMKHRMHPQHDHRWDALKAVRFYKIIFFNISRAREKYLFSI